ncbi:MAG: DUF1653 domain-containing protein [Candidatus Andersenbacteria bacterium]
MADAKDRAQERMTAVAPLPGECYQHYKGGAYEIVVCALQEDTLEPLVIYRSLAHGSLWARTLTNWNETVRVNGTSVKRFKKYYKK